MVAEQGGGLTCTIDASVAGARTRGTYLRRADSHDDGGPRRFDADSLARAGRFDAKRGARFRGWGMIGAVVGDIQPCHLRILDGVWPLSCEISIGKTPTVAGYLISNIDAARATNDESTCHSGGCAVVVLNVPIGIRCTSNERIVDAVIEKPIGVIIFRLDGHDDIAVSRYKDACLAINLGSIPDYFSRRESIVRSIDMDTGCTIAFNLEVGEAAVGSSGIEAIDAVVEGVDVIEEQHVIKLVDMNTVSRAVRKHDLVDVAPFLCIDGGGLLVGGVPLGRPHCGWSDGQAISASTSCGISVQGQVLDAEVEGIDGYGQNIRCGPGLKADHGSSPSVAFEVHIRPQRQPRGDINARREVENASVVGDVAGSACGHRGVDRLGIVRPSVAFGAVG